MPGPTSQQIRTFHLQDDPRIASGSWFFCLLCETVSEHVPLAFHERFFQNLDLLFRGQGTKISGIALQSLFDSENFPYRLADQFLENSLSLDLMG